ncbi:MAG: hypothetical protein JNK72_16125 [Myxococcales bacterium]|nr:hypothetical protein [Myxococcales bacterium]
MIQLIPGSNDASPTDSFALDQKKGAWTPAASHLRTKSFPTPFAQAEMMTHVLTQLSLDPGAAQSAPETVNDKLQQTFERWRLLLLGLVLGEVVLDPVDLRRNEADNFGGMLSDLRPECRFLGLLRDARHQGMEGRKLMVGAADPHCLLWCAPRLARLNYWSDLKTRIDSNPYRQEAYGLLADWRTHFERASLWNPSHERAPAWQKGLHTLLGENTRPANALADHARMVGPLRLNVVPRAGGDAEDVIAYLPVREPQWAARFAELLFFQPVRRDAGSVELVDPNGRSVVSIRMAPRTLAQGAHQAAPGAASAAVDAAPIAGFELLAGVGRFEALANVGRGHGQAHWLEDHANAQGYRALVLNPLMAAAARSHRRATLSDEDVTGFPIGYPDTIRLVVAPSSGAADGPRIMLSREVTNRAATGTPLPAYGTALTHWKPGDALPAIVAVPGATGNLAVGLVEAFGPAERRVDVGELRALGFALFLYFMGEAELRSDGARILWTHDDGKELCGRVVFNQTERALEVLRDGLNAVMSETERARCRDRLATLQRFAATWRSVGEGDAERPEVQAARLGRVAVEHFLHWVLGAPGGFVIGQFGLKAAAPAEHYVLGLNARLPLYLDVFARD